ncbi:MAG: hypothetical protein GY816_19370 [Cytophagales bacterium]|nr:hypothetical protein [Cytophagales bacterium]
MRKLLLISAGLMIVGMVSAQDLSSIGKPNPLTINGSLSFNQIGYGAIGIDSRRDPYTFFASGNLTFGFYGWSVPLSYTYSNQQGSFSQPFNQYSLHPTYKGFTGHLGYTSMNFSPYTLAGHLFFGAGLEGTVGKIKTSVMHGRLRKAIQPDTLNPEKAVYQRMGYGTKISYSHESTAIDLSIFRGKDLKSSVSFEEIDSVTVKPEQNLVFGLTVNQQLFSRFSVVIDFAMSAITQDTRLGAQDLVANKFFGNFGSIFKANSTTAFYDAYKIGTNYTGNGYTIGVGYERVDPGYRSHGAYYFVNDLENVTLNGSKSLFGGKVSLSATGGVQRDNLKGEAINTMKRVVGSGSLAYTPSNRLSLNSSYSNFQTYTNIRSQFVDINQLTPYDNLDTLDFKQISQSVTLGGNYVLLQSETKRKNLGLNLTYQGAKDEQGGLEQSGGNVFYLMSGNYSVSFVPTKINISGSFNYNNSQTAGITSEALGPSLSFSKSLKENKMNLSAGASWNQSRTDGKSQGSVASLRLGGRYVLKEKHNFNLGITTVKRSTKSSETAASNFTEFTATLGYSYSFSKSDFFSKE